MGQCVCVCVCVWTGGLPDNPGRKPKEVWGWAVVFIDYNLDRGSGSDKHACLCRGKQILDLRGSSCSNLFCDKNLRQMSQSIAQILFVEWEIPQADAALASGYPLQEGLQVRVATKHTTPPGSFVVMSAWCGEGSKQWVGGAPVAGSQHRKSRGDGRVSRFETGKCLRVRAGACTTQPIVGSTI